MYDALETLSEVYLQIFNEYVTLDILYVMCLILLFWKRSEWKRGFYLIGLPGAVAVILLMNPFFVYFYVKYISPVVAIFSRQSWLFFIYYVIAYTIVKVFLTVKGKLKKTAVLLFVVLVLSFQDCQIPEFYFEQPQNLYKIPDDSIRVYEAIARDGHIEKQGTLVRKGMQVKVLLLSGEGRIDDDEMSTDGKLFYGLRMYTSDFVMYAKVTELGQLESGKCQLADTYEDVEGLDEPDYIIVPDRAFLLENSRQDRWRLVEKVGDYIIYAQRKEAKQALFE